MHGSTEEILFSGHTVFFRRAGIERGVEGQCEVGSYKMFEYILRGLNVERLENH